jgi:hypothetical protein
LGDEEHDNLDDDGEEHRQDPPHRPTERFFDLSHVGTKVGNDLVV